MICAGKYASKEDKRLAEKQARHKEYVKHKERYRASGKRWVEDNRDKLNAYQREYRRKHPLAHREVYLRYEHGIDLEAYNELYNAQGGCCAGCGEDRPSSGPRGLHVDHDHATGKVRGLLCGNCNRALGLLADNDGTLLMLAAYVRSHKEALA